MVSDIQTPYGVGDSRQGRSRRLSLYHSMIFGILSLMTEASILSPPFLTAIISSPQKSGKSRPFERDLLLLSVRHGRFRSPAARSEAARSLSLTCCFFPVELYGSSSTNA